MCVSIRRTTSQASLTNTHCMWHFEWHESKLMTVKVCILWFLQVLRRILGYVYLYLGFFLDVSTPVPLALCFWRQERIYRGTLFSTGIWFELHYCITVFMGSQVGFLTARQTLQEQQPTCGAPQSPSFPQFNYCIRSSSLIILLSSHFSLTCFNYTLHVPLRERLTAAK